MYPIKIPRLDTIVRDQLCLWPNDPPGLVSSPNNTWLRGRPDESVGQCFLKQPGSDRLRTLPDGLWLSFGGTPAEPYVDIFVIEACSTMTNLLDKRSRFAPSTHSLMAVCPIAWLLGPRAPRDPQMRWQATGVVNASPTTPLVLPVRDLRVMYGLRPRMYQDFLRHQIPHPHEYFVPMEALTAAHGHLNPALRQLVARACVRGNFFAGAIAA